MAAWPLTARAQQADRKRRIGILMTIAANDPEAQARIVVFAQALQALGWTDGRNARIDVRWSTTRSDTLKYAAELAALPSDVILAEGSEAVGPLQAATRTIPIVFVLVPDPVGQLRLAHRLRPQGCSVRRIARVANAYPHIPNILTPSTTKPFASWAWPSNARAPRCATHPSTTLSRRRSLNWRRLANAIARSYAILRWMGFG